MDFQIINISASIMILVTFLLRKAVNNRIPHLVFILLWFAIGIRLLIPISIDTPCSFLNLQQYEVADIAKSAFSHSINSGIKEFSTMEKTPFVKMPKLAYVWLIGAVLVGTYFIIQYLLMKRWS